MAILPELPIFLSNAPEGRNCYSMIIEMPDELKAKGDYAFITVCANSTAQARAIAKRYGYVPTDSIVRND